MISVSNIEDMPYELPLLAEELTEFHAARILLLLSNSGIRGEISGLTKLAKLDFFVRYPSFFNRASQHLKKQIMSTSDSVESRMIRYHYGPWDKRYYQVLAYLESRQLITILKSGDSFDFKLTSDGKRAVQDLESSGSFADLISQMKQVKLVLGTRSGTSLKNLIYQLFEEEIANRPIGEVIQP